MAVPPRRDGRPRQEAHMDTAEPRWDFEVEYTREMRLHVAKLLWRRHQWPAVLAWAAILSTWFAILWAFRVDVFWLGVVVGMSGFSAWSYSASYWEQRRAAARFHERKMADRVEFAFSTAGMHARSEAGEWRFGWHAFEALWIFRDLWVLVALGRAFAIPIDRLPADLREFIAVRIVPTRRRVTKCRECGYDLRGQTLPRCPECGREFELKTLDRPAAPGGA